MIILEGPDCCGKTTVAKALLEHLPGWSYRHHTLPPVHPYQYFGWFMADTHPRMIVDRMHWSEVVFGQVFRGGAKLDPHQWRYLELMALCRSARVLVLTDSHENIVSRWMPAREMYPASKMDEIANGFQLLASNNFPHFESYLHRMVFRLPELVYDDGKPTERLEAIIEAERLDARVSSMLLQPSAGLGRIGTGGFVILGEGLSPNIFTDTEWPRLPWDAGSASNMLWQALDFGRIRWGCGYYTNASVFNSYETFTEYLGLICPRYLITLGMKAHTFGDHAMYHRAWDMSHVQMPHPQYIKRFANSKVPEWAADLAGELEDYRVDRELPDYCVRYSHGPTANIA